MVATKAKVAPPRTAGRPADTAAPAARAERPVSVPRDRPVAVGRDGRPIFRMDRNTEDGFQVPRGFEPDGWTYAWKRTSVFGQPDTRNITEMQRRGWSFVPADRHDGYWMPTGHKGNIEIDGLALMEIPTVVHEDMRKQDRKDANNAINGYRQRVGMAKHNSEIENPGHSAIQLSVKKDTDGMTREEWNAVSRQGNTPYEHTLD